MHRHQLYFILAISLPFIYGQFAKPYYKAAVVEYSPITQYELGRNINLNLVNYMEIIRNITRDHRKMDIIVMPEATLFFQFNDYSREEVLEYATFIPDPLSNHNPCKQRYVTAYYVRLLSCLALERNVYLSINLIEKTVDETLYNTNIVFDRHGFIVSRYRKRHLYDEDHLDVGHTHEVFTTDFGVTFGVMICFDSLFGDTSHEYRRQGVEHILYPLYFFSFQPILSAMQVQQMWSLRNDAVLLAAGGHNATTGTTGTGIYLGRWGSIGSVYSSNSQTRILVARIPKTLKDDKRPLALNQKLPHLRDGIRDVHFGRTQFPGRVIHPLNKLAPDADQEFQLCDGDFCCAIVVNVNDTSGLSVFTFDGSWQISDSIRFGVQMCGLLQCDSKDVWNCNTLVPEEYYSKEFKKLEVEIVDAASKSKSSVNEIEIFPVVTKANLEFVPSSHFEYNASSNKLSLLNATKSISAFLFFGRNYKQDLIEF